MWNIITDISRLFIEQTQCIVAKISLLILSPLITLIWSKYFQLNQIYMFSYIFPNALLVGSHAPKVYPEIRLIPSVSNVITNTE